MASHLLGSLLGDVAAGRFPEPDGSVTILPQPSPRYAGVFAFTAHSVICTDADPAWVRGQLPPGDLSAPMLPPFLSWSARASPADGEAAIEVNPGGRGRGLGRALAIAARHLVPAGAPVWAQIAPGNAASVRAFLAAGFAPVGAGALLLPGG